jgi:hypothetical protein
MNESTKKSIKSTQIIYSSLIVSTAIFLIITIALKYMGRQGSIEGDLMTYQVFQLVSFIVGISSIGGGIFIFNKKIKAIQSTDISEKLAQYRTAMIIRAAAIEGASFFFIVGFFLFQVDFFIIATLIGLGILAFFFPTNSRIAKELGIEERELKG